MLPLPVAGVPTNNDITYCPVNSTSCYFYSSTGRAYGTAQTYCASLGGTLVSWNTDAEQLDVSGADSGRRVYVDMPWSGDVQQACYGFWCIDLRTVGTSCRSSRALAWWLLG